jgi:general secretion pathway protein M
MKRLTALLEPALASARQQAQPLLERYEALQPRERLFVSVGAVVVALALVWGLVWQPAANARKNQLQALSDVRAEAERLEAIAVAVQKARAAGGGAIQGQGQSLLTLVDQQGRAPELGKAPTRLQPEGDNEVRVWFEDVPFDALVRWMASLEKDFGVQIAGAEFERRAGSGLVNARLTVTRP